MSIDATFDPGTRATLIGSLDELTRFLAGNTDLPVPGLITVYSPVNEGSHGKSIAEVDRIAGLLGEKARKLGGGAYGVSTVIAPGVIAEYVHVVADRELAPLAAVPAQRDAVNGHAA